MGMDASRGFASKEHVDPLQHLVAAAVGLGGLPEKMLSTKSGLLNRVMEHLLPLRLKMCLSMYSGRLLFKIPMVISIKMNWVCTVTTISPLRLIKMNQSRLI